MRVMCTWPGRPEEGIRSFGGGVIRGAEDRTQVSCKSINHCVVSLALSIYSFFVVVVVSGLTPLASLMLGKNLTLELQL